MKAEAFLSHCDKVRATGTGTWIACCPHHKDKTPSMTVRELDDGRVLVHCFGGCSVEQILGAVGLTFDALFPDKPTRDHIPGPRLRFPAADVLAALAEEMMVVAVITSDIERAEWPTQDTIDRLQLANRRIQTALEYALGRR